MRNLLESASVAVRIAKNVTDSESVSLAKMEKYQTKILAGAPTTAGNVTEVVGAIAILATSDIR